MFITITLIFFYKRKAIIPKTIKTTSRKTMTQIPPFSEKIIERETSVTIWSIHEMLSESERLSEWVWTFDFLGEFSHLSCGSRHSWSCVIHFLLKFFQSSGKRILVSVHSQCWVTKFKTRESSQSRCSYLICSLTVTLICLPTSPNWMTVSSNWSNCWSCCL
jgi:hypothetical protein